MDHFLNILYWFCSHIIIGCSVEIKGSGRLHGKGDTESGGASPGWSRRTTKPGMGAKIE